MNELVEGLMELQPGSKDESASCYEVTGHDSSIDPELANLSTMLHSITKTFAPLYFDSTSNFDDETAKGKPAAGSMYSSHCQYMLLA